MIDANPVFKFILAGIMKESNWRRVLGEAYLKYVESEKPQRAVTPSKAEPFAKKEQSKKEVIFGVGDSESSKFTVSRMM